LNHPSAVFERDAQLKVNTSFLLTYHYGWRVCNQEFCYEKPMKFANLLITIQPFIFGAGSTTVLAGQQIAKFLNEALWRKDYKLVMRGIDARQSAMFSYLSPEQRVPKDHPLRRIRVASVVNANTLHGIGSKLIIS